MEVEVNWYDGGIKPMLPDNWPAGKNPNKSGGGTFFYGTKGILHAGCYGVSPEIIGGDGWNRTTDTGLMRAISKYNCVEV